MTWLSVFLSILIPHRIAAGGVQKKNDNNSRTTGPIPGLFEIVDSFKCYFPVHVYCLVDFKYDDEKLNFLNLGGTK